MTTTIVLLVTAASIAVALDQLSTYYFTKPSSELYNDAGRFERNRILRWLLRRYGVRGQLVYAPIEFVGFLGATTLLYLLLLKVVGAVFPLDGWALEISLLAPAINLAIAIRLNYSGGRMIRSEVR
jgi:hypothetical protein